jgi:hypothetical protein
MKPNDIAIRKRSQIAKANKTMFIWIAVASALVGSALVVSFFLAQKAMFNEEVLSLKQQTVSNLNNNNEVASVLEGKIKVLDTNQALILTKANEGDQAIQVILDALPSDGNSLALGASIQNKLLTGVPGLIAVESLTVDPIVGIESFTDETTVDASAEGESVNQVTFHLSLKASQDAVKTILKNFERSIRLITITSLQIESQIDGDLVTIQGKAYYEPAKSIELRTEVLKP